MTVEALQLPFQAHSATSKAAARHAKPMAETKRQHLLALFQAAGILGMTDDEAEQVLGWPGNTVRPRRVELIKSGQVKDSGRTRETRSGRQATVWMVVQ